MAAASRSPRASVRVASAASERVLEVGVSWFELGNEARRELWLTDLDRGSDEGGEQGPVVRVAPRVGVQDLGEQRCRSFSLTQGCAPECERPPEDQHVLRGACSLGGGVELVQGAGNLSDLAPHDPDADLRCENGRAIVRGRLVDLVSLDVVGAHSDRLVVTPGIDEEVEQRTPCRKVDHFLETPSLRERDAFPDHLEPRLGPFEDPHFDREVVVEDPHLTSISGLDRDIDRGTHVVETRAIPELASGHTAGTERMRQRWESKILRNRERPFGVIDPGYRLPLKHRRTSHPTEGCCELRAWRQGLEEGERGRTDGGPARIAGSKECLAEDIHGPCLAGDIAHPTVEGDPLFQRLLRLNQTTALQCGLAEPNQRRGPSVMPRRSERKRPLEGSTVRQPYRAQGPALLPATGIEAPASRAGQPAPYPQRPGPVPARWHSGTRARRPDPRCALAAIDPIHSAAAI